MSEKNAVAVNTPGFADLNLPHPLVNALIELNFTTPSPIQEKSIPILLSGEDIIGIAQTGTGKTAAFGLPTLAHIQTNSNATQALILVPTRELAIQVCEAIKQFSVKMTGVKTLAIYGGQSMSTQLQALKKGVQVVVGTPGRVIDHIKRGTLKLGAIKTIVLDEADEMLRMGFIDDVTWVLDQAPKSKQVALFSATMPKTIRKVADNYLNQPKEVRLAINTDHKVNIEQRFWVSHGSSSKQAALLRFLAVENFEAAIIFVRTKAMTVEIAQLLEAQGHRTQAIHGDLTQPMRERCIEQLKLGEIDLVVATDVAARGIDVSRIGLVVNYDAPFDSESYVHRIGRTGRAGRSGKAIIFLDQREKTRQLQALERTSKGKLTSIEPPTDADIRQSQLQRFHHRLNDALEAKSHSFTDITIEQFVEEKGYSIDQLAQALITLANPTTSTIPQIPSPKAKKQRTKPGEFSPQKRTKSKNTIKRDMPSHRKQEPAEMTAYHISVGKCHRVGAGDIVGAIANEANLNSAFIGKIRLFDNHSTIDLPAGMPKSTFNHLKKVRVRNQPLNIKPLSL